MKGAWARGHNGCVPGAKEARDQEQGRPETPRQLFQGPSWGTGFHSEHLEGCDLGEGEVRVHRIFLKSETPGGTGTGQLKARNGEMIQGR